MYWSPYLLGKRAALIDDAAARDVPALEAGIGDVLEIAVGVRILQLAVLGESFDVVGALHLVQHGGIAPVGAGDHVAVPVEIGPQVLPPPSANSSNFLVRG